MVMTLDRFDEFSMGYFSFETEGGLLWVLSSSRGFMAHTHKTPSKRSGYAKIGIILILSRVVEIGDAASYGVLT